MKTRKATNNNQEYLMSVEEFKAQQEYKSDILKEQYYFQKKMDGRSEAKGLELDGRSNSIPVNRIKNLSSPKKNFLKTPTVL